ncbi:MAG: hypothetical protein KY458_12165, partial [Actinobacteria bacterium]|nr:hypothetical protein [Actinomycetota bacterium]
MAVAIVLALVASISAGPMASAQEAPPPPTGNEAAAVVPEIFEPAAINRTPVGSAAPAAAEQLLTTGAPAGLGESAEVVERRTQDSRTFLTEDGKFETTFYGGAVNYLDSEGLWQPIDNSLVPVEGSNGALRNAAGPVEVTLPAVLGAEPVRATNDDISVAFTMNEADAVASPGTSTAVPPAATEAAAKATATYASALPGVDVSYAATSEGVKEDVVLAGPEAPTSFDFTVEASPGLTAIESTAGGIDFVDGEGVARATFAPPFAYDANFESTGAESAFSEDAVSLSIVETSPQLVVRLAADPTWLAAPERAWPVVIDPTLVINPANTGDSY